MESHNDKLQTENEELSNLIEARKVELKSLSSMGLMKMIQSIPELIKQDVQSFVSGYWKGDVLNFYEKKMNVAGIEQDIVEIHLRNGDHEYFIEINEKDGLVWYNGAEKPFKRKDSGQVMYMPEMARYFREKISGEAKELVNSLYKKTEVNVVWNCRLDYDTCRIIKHPDGKFELQKRELSKESGDRSMIWTRKNVFRSFKEMGGDKNNIFLRLTHSDGTTEYVNQYGEKINNQQLRSIGISVNQRGVHF